MVVATTAVIDCGPLGEVENSLSFGAFGVTPPLCPLWMSRAELCPSGLSSTHPEALQERYKPLGLHLASFNLASMADTLALSSVDSLMRAAIRFLA